MSQYFLLGGFVGFAIVFFLSLWSGASVHVALRNGMIGCLVLGFLVRVLCGRIAQAVIDLKIQELEKLQQEKKEAES